MKRIFLLCLVLLLSFGLVSCRKDSENSAESVTFDEENIEEYVKPFAYTGLTVELSSADSLRSEAVWRAVLDHAEILAYPEDLVAYYVEQGRDTYRYYAEENDWSYEQTLEFFSVTEEKILEEARQMVKGDLVYRYIVKNAEISLSDEEKTAQFDRYVQKFSEGYGYAEEYVVENMSELIYDSMLYDKTMEYLIVNNTFVGK